MNTDKIFAEAIANEYAPKDTSKVVALKEIKILNNGIKQKIPQSSFTENRSTSYKCRRPESNRYGSISPAGF